MKNQRITFRLSVYQLARGLQTIRSLEPDFKLIGINDIVKVIYHDYLAKMNVNKLDDLPKEILNEVTSFIETPAKGQLTVAELMSIAEQTSEEHEKQVATKVLEEINKIPERTKASEVNDPNKTESEISSVTDFSPPKDWKE